MYGQKSCGLKIVGQMVFGQYDIRRNVFERIVLHPSGKGSRLINHFAPSTQTSKQDEVLVRFVSFLHI